MSREKMALVDEKDEVLGYKWRDELVESDRYRIVGVWIESPDGHVLLAQRSKKKKLHPGLWGPAAAGGVAHNEEYEEAAIKETSEELGIEPRLELVKKFAQDIPQDLRMIAYYSATIPRDTTLKIQKSEVETVEWVPREQLAKDLKTHPERYVFGARYWPELFNLTVS